MRRRLPSLDVSVPPLAALLTSAAVLGAGGLVPTALAQEGTPGPVTQTSPEVPTTPAPTPEPTPAPTPEPAPAPTPTPTPSAPIPGPLLPGPAPIGVPAPSPTPTPGPVAGPGRGRPVGPDGQPLSRAEALVLRLETQPLPVGQPVPDVTPRQDRGGFIAKILETTPVRNAPGGSRTVWTAKTTSVHTGNATRLMVIKARFDAAGHAWLGVQLPIRPNETIGWIRADSVRIEFTPVFVHVRLDDRSVSVYRAGRLASRTRSVIGAPRTPTPRGLFAVYETADQGNPNSYLGPWALHLTAFSKVLKNYGGGPGRAAIHGRGPASIADAKLGRAASHGCIRTPNTFVNWLRVNALPGTPVLITQR